MQLNRVHIVLLIQQYRLIICMLIDMFNVVGIYGNNRSVKGVDRL